MDGWSNHLELGLNSGGQRHQSEGRRKELPAIHVLRPSQGCSLNKLHVVLSVLLEDKLSEYPKLKWVHVHVQVHDILDQWCYLMKSQVVIRKPKQWLQGNHKHTIIPNKKATEQYFDLMGRKS